MIFTYIYYSILLSLLDLRFKQLVPIYVRIWCTYVHMMCNMNDVQFVPCCCCCRGEWIFGYPAESLVGQAAHVLRHPGDQLSIQELVQTKDYSES